jgi:hypothetical protein
MLQENVTWLRYATHLTFKCCDTTMLFKINAAMLGTLLSYPVTTVALKFCPLLYTTSGKAIFFSDV